MWREEIESRFRRCRVREADLAPGKGGAVLRLKARALPNPDHLVGEQNEGF